MKTLLNWQWKMETVNLTTNNIIQSNYWPYQMDIFFVRWKEKNKIIFFRKKEEEEMGDTLNVVIFYKNYKIKKLNLKFPLINVSWAGEKDVTIYITQK